MNSHTATQPADAGLWALLQVARHYRIAACLHDLAHQYGPSGEPFGNDHLQHAARSLGFVTHIQRGYRRLDRLPLPAIARDRNHQPYVMWRWEEGKAWIQGMGDPEPFPVSGPGLRSRYNGTALLLRPTRKTGEPVATGFQWYWPTLRKYRSLLLRVLLAGSCLLAFSLITPLFFQVVMDKVLVHNSLPTLAVMMVGLVAVTLFEAAFSGARYWLFAHQLARIDAELKGKLFDRLLGLPSIFFSTQPIGDIASRMREMDTVRNFLTQHSLAIALDGLFSMVFLAVMFAYSPELTAVVAGSLLVYAAVALSWGPLLHRRAASAQALAAENQAFLVESINAAHTLKALGAEHWSVADWDTRLTRATLAQRRLGLSAANAQECIALTGKLVSAGTLWLGAQAVMANDLTIGSFIAFNLFAGRVAQPALRLGQVWAEYQRAKVALQRLSVLLHSPIHATLGASPCPRLEGRVELDSVCFRYGVDGPFVLDRLSFEVLPGECVGITGASGSGKSTLVSLLLGFGKPEKGEVRMDGVDIATVSAESLRRQVGVVMQRPFLFRGTVHENISLGQPGASRDQVIQAAQLAGAHTFIEHLPKGYDAPLTEAGSNLSGGQRQRLAIARALLSDPRVLIFDEATSALDSEAQAHLQEAMPAICRGRTVIMIAHRLETLSACDRLLVLDNGRLLEEGSPCELAGLSGGHYARLLRLQQGQMA